MSDHVEVYDPAQVPEDLCEVTVTMPAYLWRRAKIHMSACHYSGDLDQQFKGLKAVSTPALSLIAERLNQPCGTCYGTKGRTFCSACHGTGKQSAPGCRLKEKA
jgi:hypothetical protein